MIAFLIVVLIPMFLIFDHVYYNSINRVKTEIIDRLQAIATLKQHKLNIIIGNEYERLRLVTSRTKLRSSLKNYNKYGRAGDQEMIEQIIKDAKAVVAEYQCLTVLDPQGKIIASTATDPWKINCLTREAIEAGKSKEHFGPMELAGNSLTMFLSAPLVLDDEIVGEIVIKASGQKILDAAQNYVGLGKKGEVLIGKQFADGEIVFLTPTRYKPVVPLEKWTKEMSRRLGVDIEFLKEGKLITGLDYRGVPVLAVTRYIDSADLGLLVKVDEEEIYAPVRKLRNGILVVIALNIFITVVLSLGFSRTLSRPIIALRRGVEKIGQGNFDYRVGTKDKDEIGELSRAFDEMVGNLRRMTTSRDQLDKEVKSRQAVQEQLERKLHETEVFQKAAVDRELKMRELKEEIRRLKEEKHG